MKNLVIVCLFIFFKTIGQPNQQPATIDSLLTVLSQQKSSKGQIETYIQLAKQYRNIDPNVGIEYGNKGLQLAKKTQSSDQIASSMISLGDNYYNLGNIDKANNLYQESLRYCKSSASFIDAYIAAGKIHLSNGDYSNALAYNFKALKISEDTKNEKATAGASYYIGMCYNYLMKPENAIAYFKKALVINKKLNLKKGICSNLHGLATQYEFMHDYNQALYYLSAAKKIAEEINDKFGIATISTSKGNVLFRQNKIEEALENTLLGKKLAAEINNKRVESAAKFIEGRIYLNLYKSKKSYNGIDLLKKAEILFKDCIDIENSFGNKSVVSQSYELISEVYSLQNRHKEAKDYYILFNKHQDSLYNEDNRETIKNIEDKRTIDLKNKEIEINKLKLINQQKQKWFFIAGLAFLGIIGGLLFYQSRNRQRTNEKLQQLNAELDEANKAKTRFFSILNHDLRGPVANLIFFLQLQKESPELLDEESIQRMQDKTMTGAENLLASMEDILQWSKSQMENFKPQPQKFQIATLFEDTQKHFLSVENIEFQFENPNNLVLVTDENYLKTIVRNLTGNAVKALANVQNPTIVWNAFQENGATILSITDNGKGASQDEFKALYDEKEVVGIKTGLGLHLIRDLAKAIDCEISVNSKMNEGTTITLKL